MKMSTWPALENSSGPKSRKKGGLSFTRIAFQILVLHMFYEFKPTLAFFDSKKSSIHIIQDESTKTGDTRYKVADINYHHVEKPFMLSVWILIASFAKIGFHLSPKPSSYIPESCMLILLGVFSGMIIFFSRIGNIDYTLSTGVFFLFLLPPIVLEAGYFMPRRPFFENIGTILLLAVVGTLWNTLCMGLALWGISRSGLVGFQVPLLHCLLFSSLISAVDPVAILAVFEEAQVNEVLHIVVFGESLLNDGVAVVLYNMFGVYSKIGYQNIIPQDIVNGILSFFVVALGGTLIGVLFGIFIGWLTKYTVKVTIIEPLFVFLLAYVSYLVADMFKLSGILAIVFCGITMRKYVEANIAPKSETTVKYTMKMLSSMCESIIFLFLGLSTVVDYHVWNTAFTLFSIFFSLLFRALGVLIMIPFLNRRRLIKMGSVDIFILIYGGLRGAISFSLALLLDEASIGEINKKMFVTTTVTIVIFTSFFQGLTIRPLVEVLRVKKAVVKDKNMGEILFERVFESKYLKPYLMKRVPQSRENKLIEVCTKLNLKDANAYIQQCGGDIHAMKKDLSMMDDSQAIGDMPVIDTSHLDPVYSNREDNDKWHGMMEDIMYQPRQKIKKYSRHMLFDNPSHVSIQTTPAHRHTSRLKTSRPLLEPKSYKKPRGSEKTLSKTESIRSKTSMNSNRSRYGGIGATLRRLSLSLTGSPTHEAPLNNGIRRPDDAIYFSATPLKKIPEVPSSSHLEVNGSTANTIKPTSAPNQKISPNEPYGSEEGVELIENKGVSPSASLKQVNFIATPKPVPSSSPKSATKRSIQNQIVSDDPHSGREDERLLKDEDSSGANTSTPPKIPSSTTHPPKPPHKLSSAASMEKNENTFNKVPINVDISQFFGPLRRAPPLTPNKAGRAVVSPISIIVKDHDKSDKLIDISEDKNVLGDQASSQEAEKNEEEPSSPPKDELTIAEKALPWKTPSPHPQKMPNPPRKLSDAYFNSPANLSSILEQNPAPPPSNQELLEAKLGNLGVAENEALLNKTQSSDVSSSASFISAYPTPRKDPLA